ncbi:uncharacterized protein LOC141721259 [Apium graveolens]|uniref:uncharacterized protein LOC141721259 n=1 Tax=Apium graveolens TaxID=4045 RepID=UPI003D7A6061
MRIYIYVQSWWLRQMNPLPSFNLEKNANSHPLHLHLCSFAFAINVKFGYGFRFVSLPVFQSRPNDMTTLSGAPNKKQGWIFSLDNSENKCLGGSGTV